jgi:hypothetical protein
MNVYDIEKKRKFWRRVVITGVVVLFLGVATVVWTYLSVMNEARSGAGDGSEMEQEIAMLNARNGLFFTLSKWLVFFGLLASLLINVARYKLRKLKKLENAVDISY